MVGTGPITYQWHIFLTALDPTKGSEQAGRRPVLVIRRERNNQLLPVVNVIPLTSLKISLSYHLPERSSTTGRRSRLKSRFYCLVLPSPDSG